MCQDTSTPRQTNFYSKEIKAYTNGKNWNDNTIKIETVNKEKDTREEVNTNGNTVSQSWSNLIIQDESVLPK